jgi:hypothetical protein
VSICNPLKLLFRGVPPAASFDARSARWDRQSPDPPQHLAKQTPVQMPLGQQEPIIAGMLDQPAACFHQPLLQAR